SRRSRFEVMRLVRFRSNCRRSFCRCKLACGSSAHWELGLLSSLPLMEFSKKCSVSAECIPEERMESSSVGSQILGTCKSKGVPRSALFGVFASQKAEPHVQGDVAAGRAHEATEIALEVINALDDAHADRGPGVGTGGGAMEEHNGKLVGHRRSKPASTAGRRYPPSRRAMMPK